MKHLNLTKSNHYEDLGKWREYRVNIQNIPIMNTTVKALYKKILVSSLHTTNEHVMNIQQKLLVECFSCSLSKYHVQGHFWRQNNPLTLPDPKSENPRRKLVLFRWLTGMRLHSPSHNRVTNVLGIEVFRDNLGSLTT